MPLHFQHSHSITLILVDSTTICQSRIFFLIHELIKKTDPNPWNDDFNLLSVQDDIQAYFEGDGSLIKPNNKEQKTFQFAATISNVLLSEKANLEYSLQGYCMNAFLCTVVGFLPQLSAFADMMDEESGLKKLGTKSIWSLLMWIMEDIVTVKLGVVPLYWWPEAGIVASEELDKFAQNIVVQLVYSPPADHVEHSVYARYCDIRWLNEDLGTLRRCATLAYYYGGGLNNGYCLEQTVREMEAQLERIAAEQIEE